MGGSPHRDGMGRYNLGGTLKRNRSDTDDPYRSYGCRRLTEGAGRLLTRARRFGLTATVAGSALSTPPSTTGAFWTRGRKGRGRDGCFPVKDEEDDDDKDDDQDTKKQHSITGGDICGDASVPTPLSLG